MEVPTAKYDARDAALAELEKHMGIIPNAFDGDRWPEPEPLGGKLPPVAKMTADLLPLSLRPMVEDVAERMQVPLDFPAVVAVATLAGVVGRRAFIQPKQADSSWQVVPNLWGGIVAEPGSMKSGVISAITAPARELESAWLSEHKDAMRAYQQAAEGAELASRAWKEEAANALKSAKPIPSRPEGLPEPPPQRRLMTQDATIEKLHEMNAQNPGGLFVLRDELTGWLAQLEKRGAETDRTFYLEAWNGDQPYTLDRIGRGSICVPYTCVSLFGSIQPSRLRQYLSEVLRGGPANDGLVQRFQLLVWPDAPSARWKYVDRVPNMAAQAKAAAVYKRLALMDPLTPLHFRFDVDAQQLFIAWLTDLEARKQALDPEEAMRAHLAKYRSLMPSLALLFALADGATDTCSLSHAQLAASWCYYLETHAGRVYAAQVATSQAAAATLGRKLAGGELGGSTFSLRDVYQKHWSGLGSPEEARAALLELEGLHWVRRLEAPAGGTGRKPEMYAINPRLEAHHAEC